MAIECLVITALLLISAIVFFRSKHVEWAFATFPLILVPMADFIAEIMLKWVLKLDISEFVFTIILVAAVAASCAWIGIVSAQLTKKRSRASYVIISDAFNIILAAILIHNFVQA